MGVVKLFKYGNDSALLHCLIIWNLIGLEQLYQIYAFNLLSEFDNNINASKPLSQLGFHSTFYYHRFYAYY